VNFDLALMAKSSKNQHWKSVMELFAVGLRPDTNSEAFKAGWMLGAMAAMTICGAIPLVQGLKRGHPILGTMGALLTAGTAWFLGCIGGLPVAFVFSVIIRALGTPVTDDATLRAEVERQRDRDWQR
jgi:hypothetical protein